MLFKAGVIREGSEMEYIGSGVETTDVESAALKVFAIPELLEQIFEYCSLCDLFRFQAVCRTWKKTFNDSSMLQKKAQLHSAADDLNWDWYEDDWDQELGLFVDCQYPDLARDGSLYFQLYFRDKNEPIRVTHVQRRCFATQPPCFAMQVRPWCCTDQREGLARETGITVGDLVDTARRIKAEHEHCPVKMQQRKERGSFDTNQLECPKFSGTVKLPKNHAVRLREVARRKVNHGIWTRKMKDMQNAGWSVIWEAFANARADAQADGEEAPRWPEFLAERKDLAAAGYQLNASEAGALDFVRLPPPALFDERTLLPWDEESRDDESEAEERHRIEDESADSKDDIGANSDDHYNGDEDDNESMTFL